MDAGTWPAQKDQEVHIMTTEDKKPEYIAHKSLHRPEHNPRSCPIYHLADSEVVEDFLDFALRYVEYRAFGHPPIIAWYKTFGMLDNTREDHARSERYEYNPVIQSLYEYKLKELSVDKLWTAKAAAHRLLSIALSPDSKCSTQVAAAKELNVMFGITIVDENGKTRAARTAPAEPKNDR
jgi:hypothetical protein